MHVLEWLVLIKAGAELQGRPADSVEAERASRRSGGSGSASSQNGKESFRCAGR